MVVEAEGVVVEAGKWQQQRWVGLGNSNAAGADGAKGCSGTVDGFGCGRSAGRCGAALIARQATKDTATSDWI